MKVLFIGGTGIISSACSQLALQNGIELYLLNRGKTTIRPIPAGAHLVTGDIRDPLSVKRALAGKVFDSIVNWVAFTPEHIETDLALFRDKTSQYIFISSASAYQTPPSSLPVTESTILDNPIWAYSQAKIACEDRLVLAFRQEKFPMTIVRPSHTYDQTLLPFDGGYTVIDRMRKGKRVIVHGDGTSLWVMTHHTDFAKGFVGLLGNSHSIGEAIQITSDELLTWNQIFRIMARAAKTEYQPVHIPSDLIAAFDPEWGASLLGDKANSMIFDNTKIKRLVPGFSTTIPFSCGAEQIMTWYDADPKRQVIDPEVNEMMDRILEAYESAWPKENISMPTGMI